MFNALTDSLGMSIVNIDNANINFSGIEIRNTFDSQKDIMRKLNNYYYV